MGDTRCKHCGRLIWKLTNWVHLATGDYRCSLTAEPSPVDIPAAREQAKRALWQWVGYSRSADLCAVARETVPALLDQLEAAQARVRELEATVQRVEEAYNLQCGRPLKRSDYVDSGAYMAHLWWQTVLGGALRDAAALRGSDD